MTARPGFRLRFCPLVPAVLIIVVGVVTEARADEPTKEQCMSANEAAQSLRQSGKLEAARAQLLTCVAKSCSAAVRDDCNERLDELTKAVPTIVFTAKGAGGADLVAVRVTVDGAVLAERLDGTALSVEPGEHTFEFTTEGFAPMSKKLVVREGVKARQEAIDFAASADPGAVRTARLVVAAQAASTVAIDGTVAGMGRYDGRLPPGTHEIRVTEPGKVLYKANVDLQPGVTRTIEVTLENEPRRAAWPWLVGGAVLLTAGAVVGGYFLFAPEDRTAPPPMGKLGSVTFSTFGR
jgi:hypothetical protein